MSSPPGQRDVRDSEELQRTASTQDTNILTCLELAQRRTPRKQGNEDIGAPPYVPLLRAMAKRDIFLPHVQQQ